MNEITKHIVALIFVPLSIVASLFLSSCQATEVPESRGEIPVPTVETATVPEEAPTIDLTEEMKATKPWRFAFVPKEKFYAQTGHLGAYWQPAWEGAEQASKDFGVKVELVALTALCDTDAECIEPQIRLIADLIEQSEIDGMIIAPLDSNRLAPVVNKAIAAGIPTVAMDTPLSSDQLLTFVVFDNFTAGQAMGEWVVEQLGGAGRALILEGPTDQQNAIDRRNGFLAGLGQGDIDILDTQSADWEVEPAKEITMAWLQKFSEIDVIMAANDDMALGAAEAVAEVNRSGVLITGFDATNRALTAIEAGQMTATIDQAPGEQARLSIQLLIRHLEKGETFPPIVLMPDIPLITETNVGEYLSGK